MTGISEYTRKPGENGCKVHQGAKDTKWYRKRIKAHQSCGWQVRISCCLHNIHKVFKNKSFRTKLSNVSQLSNNVTLMDVCWHAGFCWSVSPQRSASLILNYPFAVSHKAPFSVLFHNIKVQCFVLFGWHVDVLSFVSGSASNDNVLHYWKVINSVKDCNTMSNHDTSNVKQRRRKRNVRFFHWKQKTQGLNWLRKCN